MLVDEIDITLKAGNGAPGKVSFGKGIKSGPDGGNGGDGGDLYIEAVSDIKALNQFTKDQTKAAEDGVAGGTRKQSGKSGSDLVVKLPAGSMLIDKESGQTIELNRVGESYLICTGGIGGLGNFDLRSARNTTPMEAQTGRAGEIRQFSVILRLIANYGLIGLPNSGKSSLLNELTAAKAETADYPFTTLEPNLGVLNGKTIADIPGLIEGASSGRGLGIKFLKHIEKVELLLHCVAINSESVAKDYRTIKNELAKYNPELARKSEIVLLTKTDLANKEEIKEKIKVLKKLNKKVYPVSIYDWESIESLKHLLEQFS